MTEAQGFLVDKQTRCIHYHSKLDMLLYNAMTVKSTMLVIGVMIH